MISADSIAAAETIVRGACPHDCPDTCALRITVQDGRAVKVQGDPDHAPTHGALCTKVSRYPERTYHAERVLQREEITLADLRVPGLDRPFFGEAPRRFAVDATHASISPREPDDLTPKRFKCEVRFDLPRGSYATVVLRALGQ